jgi:hypothetical protein
VFAADAVGVITRLSVTTPALGEPDNVICVLTSSKTAGDHDRSLAGENARNAGDPMVPVSPVTVMVTMPPICGGFGPATTVVTLFALALIVLWTDDRVNACVRAGARAAGSDRRGCRGSAASR